MDYTKYSTKEYKFAGELDEDIEYLEANSPDKRTKEYSEWKTVINSLYARYNEIVGFKCYKQI